MRLRLYILLVLLDATSGNSIASWKIVFHTDAVVSCGFFFDGDHGLIGTGNFFAFANPPQIFRTTNGGRTWQQSATPGIVLGCVNSIFMQDQRIGYASILALDNEFLWKTTDGGTSWQDVGTAGFDRGTCVYVTSNAIIETAWRNSGQPAGVSLDGGITFNEVFGDRAYQASDGIDFADPMNGIVTMGPRPEPRFSSCWCTHDGGITWTAGAALPECWGVYAIHGSTTYLAMPEGALYEPNTNHIIYKTVDAGVTWTKGVLPKSATTEFTGHIAGKAAAVYIQTKVHFPDPDEGLYRSDDLGLTWKPISGPSNNRDSRFCVTGCKGNIVYAFDTLGNVWKTIDGGDGTLDSTLDDASLALLFDSISVKAHYCVPLVVSFPLINSGCFTLKLDSITLKGDTSAEFLIVHTPNNDTIASSKSDSISVQYQSDKNEQRTIFIHVKGLSNGKTIDTIMTLHIDNNFNGSNGPVLTVSDSAAIRTHFCEPGVFSFMIADSNCSTLIIDTIIFNDPLRNFSITHHPAGDSVTSFKTDSISLQFQSDSNVHRFLPLELKCHVAGQEFDTTLWIDAFHSRSPEPYLEDPAPTKVGDTVAIAMKILPPTDTVNISHLAFHLTYNGDILTPAGNPTQTLGTLSEHYSSLSITPTGLNGLDCSIDLATPITDASDFTKPVILLRFLVTLTKSFTCPVVLDSFSIVGNTPLSLCTIPSTTFHIIPQCSDSTLVSYMLSGNVPKFLSVIPNPADQKINVTCDLAGRESGEIQLIDMMGDIISKQSIAGTREASSVIQTSQLSSSEYFLRLITSDGTVTSRTVTITH
ncbi:MAG TPA: T9SS type A sorting domain-containing protein [Candidatus Kapabacteria bacterium]|nr:T9SS type A sorting domain-containing protein [Candidatus Kapabacteria bacterium]